MNVIYFLRSIFKKTPTVYILKPRRDIGQSLEESLRGGKLVKNFWMNIKQLFGFRTIWRIMQISEDVIHLDLQAWWKTFSSICIILHILLSLIQ